MDTAHEKHAITQKNRYRDVFSLCRQLCIETLSYSGSGELIHMLGLQEHTFHNDGFMAEIGMYLFIFYNDYLPRKKQREIVAHELAHFLMEHPLQIKHLSKKTAETEAEYLAKQLLKMTV